MGVEGFRSATGGSILSPCGAGHHPFRRSRLQRPRGGCRFASPGRELLTHAPAEARLIVA
jgi:hypothetical protein